MNKISHAALRFFKKQNVLFGVVFILETLYCLDLIVRRRIPAGHDGFQYFSLQYFFLNNAVYAHEVPQWMPFMTHGTVASWWYVIQAGFLQNVLLSVSFLIKYVNFFYVFHIGMYVDMMMLLTGCWLLGRKFLKYSVSLFFFAVTVTGSCLWLTQPWYNFHLYYCLPLILYLFHRFIETGLWRYFLGGGHLLVLQCLGNLPYFLPVQSLVIFLYFCFFLFFNPRQRGLFLGKVKWNAWAWVSIGGVIVFFYLIHTVMTFGTDQIVNYNYGRDIHGMTSLEGFLTYAGNLNLHKWIELILGFSPELDYNLYGGILILPLFLTACFYVNRKNIPHILLIIILADMSAGGLTARLFYYLWPFMHYYRHLALISPIIKIFVYLMAAVALDRLIFISHRRAGRLYWVASSACPLCIIILIAVWQFYVLPSSWETIVHGIVPSGRPELLIFRKIYQTFLAQRFWNVFTFNFLFAVLWFVWIRAKAIRWKSFILMLILMVHTVDVYGYKLYESRLRSVSISRYMGYTSFQRMPFSKRRALDEAWVDSPRAPIIKILPLRYGVQYWSNDSFLFRDSAGHPFRTDHWLRPLDRLMRTYWGQRMDDVTVKPKGLVYYTRLDFPLSHSAARKLAGIDEDKIQFFSGALFEADEARISSRMVSNDYRGDVPIIWGQDKDITRQLRLGDNARANPDYTVDDFSTDHLQLNVHTHGQPVWLLWSDIWHPYWKATVNGDPVTIDRVDLAYKIIRLKEDTNHVHFYFHSTWIQGIQYFLSVNSLVWVLNIFFLMASIIF